jgi:hypothetical protein
MSNTKNIPLEYINYLTINDQIDNEKNSLSESPLTEDASVSDISLDTSEMLEKVQKGGAAGENPEEEIANEIDEAEQMRMQQMSIYNDKFLNYAEPSKTSLYEIPQGTILYHGSLYKESFNPYDIRLGDDKLVSYFSPNKRLSADYIIGCALYPTKAGFLHKFRVKRNIPRIMIVSSFEKQPNWTLRFIEDSFCSRRFRIQLDGIGFFYPRKDESTFTSLNTDPDVPAKVTFDSEFAVCDPNYFLEYVSTQRCVSNRKLSPEYHFSK